MGQVNVKPKAQVEEDQKQSLVKQISRERKKQEALGITYNGMRYAGSPDNRQTIAEAIQFADDARASTFEAWKDSDNQFHQNLPVVDVKEAYRLIGQNRTRLIALEGTFVQQALEGTITSVDELDWSAA